MSRRDFIRLSVTPFLRAFIFLGFVVTRVMANATHADGLPNPQFGPPPEWTVASAWTAPGKLQANPSGEDFLLVDEQSHLATDEDYHHRVYQIVTDRGRQDSSQVYFYFDPSFQKLTIHQLKLIRGAEVFDRLNPDKIQVLQQERDLDSQLYNGQRSALTILDDVRLGDIIDVSYTLQGANPVFKGRFVDTALIDWSVPVRELRYRLLVPPGRTILSKIQGPSQASFSSQLRGGEQELLWRRTNTPIIEREDKVPSSHILFSYLDLTEFDSWSDVVHWAVPLYALDESPRPLLDAAAAEIRGQNASLEKRAIAALAFVQQQIRYLGIEMGPGSHQPSEPEEVLRRRFGDCKDKARLLTALLARLGLEAAPALVHSSRREATNDRLPTPYAFDHVVVALDLDHQRYILDPTMSYQRGDRLKLRHVGRYGPYLRISPASTGLEHAELGVFDASTSTFKEVFQVDAIDKPASLTVVTVAAGRAADALRLRFATHTVDQIGREYLDYYTHYYPGISQVKAIESSDNAGENTYTTTEHYQIKNLFSADADGKILRAEFQPASIWDFARTPNLAQRTQPYAISHPTRVEHQTTVNLPEDWKVTPNDEQFSDAAFNVEAHAKNSSPRTVLMNYLWESKADRVEPVRLAEYSAHAEKARKALGYQLTWQAPVPKSEKAKTQKPSAPAEDKFPLNWPMVVLAAGITLVGTTISWRLIQRKHPTPPEPPVIALTPPLDPFSYQPRVKPDLVGLGGWLVLVGLGLIVRPAMFGQAIYGARRAYFNETVWQLVTTPGGSSYNAQFGLVAPLEMMYNFAMFIYCGLLLLLFFRRSHLFPRAMQIFLGLIVGGAVFVAWDTVTLGHASNAAMDLGTYKTVFQTLVAAAIWIPYFQVSRRVKATFTR